MMLEIEHIAKRIKELDSLIEKAEEGKRGFINELFELEERLAQKIREGVGQWEKHVDLKS